MSTLAKRASGEAKGSTRTVRTEVRNFRLDDERLLRVYIHALVNPTIPFVLDLKRNSMNSTHSSILLRMVEPPGRS